MDYLLVASSIGIPPWLRSIFTASIGALIAYVVWNWLHSPYLHPSSVVHQEVIEVDEVENQRSIRLPIMNIGTKAAKNCEAVLNLRVEIDDDVVRSFHPLPWIPTRAELVVEDSDQSNQTTIPAARSETIELVRQYRNKATQVYPKIGGEKFIRTSPEDAYHQPVDESVEYSVLSSNGSRDSDAVGTAGQLNKEDVAEGQWENAVLELTVETESAHPLKVEFDATSNEEGVLTFRRRQLPWQRRIIAFIYFVIYGSRRLGR